jgi:hypothetical protein
MSITVQNHQTGVMSCQLTLRTLPLYSTRWRTGTVPNDSCPSGRRYQCVLWNLCSADGFLAALDHLSHALSHSRARSHARSLAVVVFCLHLRWNRWNAIRDIKKTSLLIIRISFVTNVEWSLYECETHSTDQGSTAEIDLNFLYVWEVLRVTYWPSKSANCSNRIFKICWFCFKWFDRIYIFIKNLHSFMDI